MLRRLLSIPFLMFVLAACSGGLMQQGTLRPDIQRSYDLQGLRFSALPDLTVSEQESFYPTADVVWRGDPSGDRIAQIGAMFETAVARNRAVLNGDVPVDIAVTLVRFHGVTNRTRYTVGGVYHVVFDLTVLDARTSAVIEPARRVVGALDAPGGTTAVQLDESGQTQKVRVTDFLTGLLRAQLI